MSPFAHIRAPEFLTPFSEVVYALPTQIANVLNKPLDQSVYLVGSFTSIVCSFILKEIKDETTKKLFSLITGLSIHFFVFGISAFASIF